LSIYSPSEYLLVSDQIIDFPGEKPVHLAKKPIRSISSSSIILGDHYKIDNPTSNKEFIISAMNLNYWRYGVLALANTLNYLVDYNNLLLKKLSPPRVLDSNSGMALTKEALSSLEIIKDSSDQKNTLFLCLDECKTFMGKRKLREWIISPLTDRNKIIKRHDKVELFLKEKNFLNRLRESYDIARLIRKMTLQSLLPHELFYLYDSLNVYKDLFHEKNELDVNPETINYLINVISSKIQTDKEKSRGQVMTYVNNILCK
jgi:DNA mismatch repair ATPase MutS